MSSSSYRRGEAPQEWLDFDYSSFFSEAWPDLGFSDEDLRALEQELLAAPTQAPVEPGTGGLRKIRVRRPGMGKRGGARVGYAYFPKYGVILVVTVFAKNIQATLTPREKQAVQNTLVRYGAHLEHLRSLSPDEVAARRATVARERRRDRK